MKHHLTLYRYLYLMRFRLFASCSCGWKSPYEYGNVLSAHLSFGKHLENEAHQNKKE